VVVDFVQVVVYFAMIKGVEWVATVRAVVSAASAVFGIQMVRALQMGLERQHPDT
jgi:hypothetical protein